MNYLEFKFNIKTIEPFRDMLLFHLNELNYETHEETDYGLRSYILKSDFNQSALDHVLKDFPIQITYSSEEIEQQNWNQVWEDAFEPVIVNENCVICAPFHTIEKVDYKLLVSPKMAFGTGHHSTTLLMSQALFDLELTADQTLLDMGCGTAILAILARKLGVGEVDAIDIDEWAYENAYENCELNAVESVNIFKGGAELLEGKRYNVILANINKNVLLADMKAYEKALSVGGTILFSGFYEADMIDVKTAGEKFGLTFDIYRVHNNWTMLKMNKQ